MAAWPTPPDAPWTRTVSPAFTSSSRNARAAVSETRGIPAATTTLTLSGLWAQWFSTACSAAAPATVNPNTASPTSVPVTPCPTSSTIPAASRPVITGPGRLLPPDIMPSRILTSMGLTPRGLDLDSNFAGTGVRLGNLVDLEHLWTAVAVVPHCLHIALS